VVSEDRSAIGQPINKADHYAADSRQLDGLAKKKNATNARKGGTGKSHLD
jgi:hypothetical protein